MPNLDDAIGQLTDSIFPVKSSWGQRFRLGQQTRNRQLRERVTRLVQEVVIRTEKVRGIAPWLNCPACGERAPIADEYIQQIKKKAVQGKDAEIARLTAERDDWQQRRILVGQHFEDVMNALHIFGGIDETNTERAKRFRAEHDQLEGEVAALKAEKAELWARLDAVSEVLAGDNVSDFLLSFPEVRAASDWAQKG